MALVACPACQGQVSAAAPVCPHCGHPLGAATAAAATGVGPLAAAAGLRAGAAAGPEETIWEGSPALKLLALDLVWTTLYALVVSLVVALGYRPALHLIAGVSGQTREVVASYEPGFRLAALAFVLVVVGRRVGGLIWRALALRSHRYRLSNQRLLLESGVLSKTIAEIDLRTVDEINFHQSFSERLLGLGQILVLSSEPGARAPRTTARLVGVPDPRDVREKLRNAAYAATGNQIFTRAT
jgi:hypothetical protein